jgi:CxxC motif-containing protein
LAHAPKFRISQSRKAIAETKPVPKYLQKAITEAVRQLSLNRPGNCGDSFAWKGKSNVYTEEEANAAGEATAVWFPTEISA